MKSFVFEGFIFSDIFVLIWFIFVTYAMYIYFKKTHATLYHFEQDDVNQFVQKIICIIEDTELNSEQKINEIEYALDYLSDETQAKILDN